MIARTPAKPTRASTQLDPEVEKWLNEHAIATGKSDINLVVTEGDAEIFVALSEKERACYEKYSFHMFDLFMARFETIKDRESTNLPKIKDASTKFLALSRHLLSFYLRSNPRVGV
jgi:hypothetical protein